jgi:hypothetical protein
MDPKAAERRIGMKWATEFLPHKESVSAFPSPQDWGG